MQSATFAFGREQVDDLSDEEAEILDAGGGRIVLFHMEGR